MGKNRWSAQDFLGLTPGVDPRRSEKLYALPGSKNYVFDSLGARTPFGNQQLLPHPFTQPRHIHGERLKLRLGDRSFLFLGEGILEWSELLGGWKWIYLTTDTTVQPYRWTSAYVNGVLFFCHPQAGLVKYTVDDETAIRLEGPGVPTNPIGICENNGRLIAFDDFYYYWSAQSDGTNFVSELGGPGFQLISDRVTGAPIAVTSYVDGTLLWTTGGVMKSEFTGDASVYRHRGVDSEYRPINSFCLIKATNDTTVVLDERGLFQCKGAAITPYAPLFNEFLIEYLQRNRLKIGQNVRLEWDELQRRLYVSVSLTYASPLYERCFVYYAPLDKWGEFNEQHYGIFPVTVKDSERARDFYCFADSVGVTRYWLDNGSREKGDGDRFANLCYPCIQKPFHSPGDEEGLTLSSSGRAQTVAGTDGLRAAYYPRDGRSPLLTGTFGLDAKIIFGLMSLTTPDDDLGRLATVTSITIGNIPTDSDVTTIDYNGLTGSEDYGNESGSDDFGDAPYNEVGLQLRLLGTIDGRTIFDSTIPDLVVSNPAQQYYACMVSGLWHMIELTAVAPGEKIHLQALGVTVTDGGLLT